MEEKAKQEKEANTKQEKENLKCLVHTRKTNPEEIRIMSNIDKSNKSKESLPCVLFCDNGKSFELDQPVVVFNCDNLSFIPIIISTISAILTNISDFDQDNPAVKDSDPL